MLKEAKRNLTKAMIMNPNKFTIYNSLGAVLGDIGNYPAAVQTLRIGIKLNPANASGYYNLGIVYEKAKEYDSAVKSLEMALKLKHKNSEAIKKKIEELKILLVENPKFNYKFGVG